MLILYIVLGWIFVAYSIIFVQERWFSNEDWLGAFAPIWPGLVLFGPFILFVYLLHFIEDKVRKLARK